jgi:predicted RNA-binding Zn-ribbon protein involved in translation (DUF1610 family)
MTENLRLIELNEIKNVRVTCKKCGVSVKLPVRDMSFKMKCPKCGEDYGRIHDSLIDLKNTLENRNASDKFDVHIELKDE